MTLQGPCTTNFALRPSEYKHDWSQQLCVSQVGSFLVLQVIQGDVCHAMMAVESLLYAQAMRMERGILLLLMQGWDCRVEVGR